MPRTLGPVVLVLVSLTATQAQAAGGIQLPRLFAPPPPRQQIAEAEIFDPYPIPYMAPINDGSRPRDFLYPPPQATRGRWPNPGTFPRSQPWLRSSAPADYPNISKWRAPLSRKAGVPAEATVAQPEADATGPELVPDNEKPVERVTPPPAEKANKVKRPVRSMKPPTDL